MLVVAKLSRVVAMLVLMIPSIAASGPVEEYQTTLRLYLIARHCELLTPDVMSGFRVKLMTFHGVGGVTARDAQGYREAVNDVVRRDWRNRGMGARDPRCRTEGRAAARAFVEFLYADD